MRPLILTIGIVICILLTTVCKAQTCTGSLGDPVIHIDFGSGTATRGPALAPGITTYTYVTGTPGDGQYTIANTTNGMYPGSWWVTKDHTGNTGGYMMVVNAYYNADVFYTQTINGLCPGTTYEFAAWIMNLLTYSGIKPNLTFTVKSLSGTTLQTYTTGDITESTSATWKQYGLTFTTPITDNSVVIQISNNANGGTGNDIALDDITFRPCGPSMVAGFNSPGTTPLNACTANPQQVNLTTQVSTGYTNPAYIWQQNTGANWTDISGATTPQYSFPQPTTTGTYLYRLASADGTNINTSSCQILSNVITLMVSQSPTATATTATPTVCEGSTLTLNGGGGDTYSWADPSGTQFSTSQNPVIGNITLAQAGNYTVTASLNGCTSQASVNITVQPKVIATVNPDVTICSGATAQLQASGGTSYKWTPSTGLSNDAIANPIASPTDTTKYTVTVTDNTCSSTATVNVNVIKPPVFSAGGNKSVILGQSVRLTGSIKGNGLTYFWTPTTFLDDPTSLAPLATPIADITYTLHVTSSCTTVTDTSQVKVYKKIVIPNVFSPNGDGVNDTWEITGLDAYAESVVSVFTRNGQLVYSVVGYSKAWDGTYNGKILPEGAYYYIIDLKNATPVLSGYITLIR